MLLKAIPEQFSACQMCPKGFSKFFRGFVKLLLNNPVLLPPNRLLKLSSKVSFSGGLDYFFPILIERKNPTNHKHLLPEVLSVLQSSGLLLGFVCVCFFNFFFSPNLDGQESLLLKSTSHNFSLFPI